MPGPAVGERAPEFTGETHLGERVSLADYRGRYLILYFYMKAFSPNCLQQARVFRDNHDDIRALGGDVLGVSIDPPERQCSFAKKTGVTFPLIADTDRRISELYGAARPLLPLDKRITYLIDPNGVVRFRFQHQFQISQHLDNVVGTLRELVEQVPAEKRIFTPKAS